MNHARNKVPPVPAHSKRAAARVNSVDAALSRVFGDPEPGRLSDPLETLVLTILSQNTNDVNRDRAWKSMKERFPGWDEVAAAPSRDLENAIRVGGLAAQKAARIRNALARVRALFGGFDLSSLRSASEQEARAVFDGMPGVGPKTLSIVLLFSLGIEAFPLDTHCLRILKRLSVLPGSTTAEKAHVIMAGLVVTGRSMPLHLNLIRFGRERCKALKPRCEGCPLREMCSYD